MCDNQVYGLTTETEAKETPDNTPKQVRSRISKNKKLKNKSTITEDQEINSSSTKQISNQWYQAL